MVSLRNVCIGSMMDYYCLKFHNKNSNESLSNQDCKMCENVQNLFHTMLERKTKTNYQYYYNNFIPYYYLPVIVLCSFFVSLWSSIFPIQTFISTITQVCEKYALTPHDKTQTKIRWKRSPKKIPIIITKRSPVSHCQSWSRHQKI